jgi:hypothetical protein
MCRRDFELPGSFCSAGRTRKRVTGGYARFRRVGTWSRQAAGAVLRPIVRTVVFVVAGPGRNTVYSQLEASGSQLAYHGINGQLICDPALYMRYCVSIRHAPRSADMPSKLSNSRPKLAELMVFVVYRRVDQIKNTDNHRGCRHRPAASIPHDDAISRSLWQNTHLPEQIPSSL